MVTELEIKVKSYDQNPPNTIWSVDEARDVELAFRAYGYKLDSRETDSEEGTVTLRMLKLD